MNHPAPSLRLLALAIVAAACTRSREPRGEATDAASTAASSSAIAPVPTRASADAAPIASSAAPAVDAPPVGLACIARDYAGRAVRSDLGWSLVLDDGASIPWDDGAQKSFEERLERPDLEDVLSIPYRTGTIVPIVDADDDPGRIRVDALFRATYGHDAKEVSAALVAWKVLGQTLYVHRRALPAFERVGARIEALVAGDVTLRPYFQGMGGTFVWRDIAGTDRQSSHSYGVSLDLSPALSDYWRASPTKIVWRNRIPQAIVDAFEAEGFIWGGRWFHYDTMHFELRPELLDPSCR